LIELALALLLLGIISSSLLHQYDLFMKKQQHSNTVTALSEINTALQDHITTYGYYPCPADLSVPHGDPSYGQSVSCTNLGPIHPCTSFDQGICRTNGGTVVIIGGVPFKELHLSDEKVYDAWKSRIKYALTATLRPQSPILSPLPPGEITVQQSDGSGTVINNAHYVLVAPGPRRVGGFNISGTISEACDTSQLEGENCDQDATFASDFNSRWRSLVEGANYFDDYVLHVDRVNSREWSVEASTPDDLRFRPDRVGIGVTDADPNTDLHVLGNIKVDDWAKALNICNGDPDPATAECFDPNAIAGSKSDMRCDSSHSMHGNQAMIGVANEKVKCVLTIEPTATVPAPCPTGWIAVGFLSTGGLNCQLPCPAGLTAVGYLGSGALDCQ
jgi:type II secretory pathway pseudopilin PulG